MMIVASKRCSANRPTGYKPFVGKPSVGKPSVGKPSVGKLSALVSSSLFSLWIVFSSLAFSLTISANAYAAEDDVLNRLRIFTMELKSFTADFEQSLYNADSDLLKNDIGKLILKRPGKFIWRYAGEGGQEFISDGKSIWMFDKELDQVTVNPLNDRLGGTPLVLLMGGVPLEDQFTVTTLGESDGIDWVELVPKDNSTDFEALFIGLNKQGLAAMELRDNLGQATQIQFSNFKTDIPLDDGQFNFVAPKGVDVIGQAVQ